MPYDPREHGAACAACPLNGRTVVPPLIYPGRRYLAVAWEPGRVEEEKGRPLVGPSGQELARAVEAAGHSLDGEFNLTNTRLCAVKKSDPRGYHAVSTACCRPRLLREVEAHDGAILLLGAEALQALGDLPAGDLLPLDARNEEDAGGDAGSIEEAEESIGRGEGAISKMRGYPLTVAGRPALATFHPAMILRQRKWTETFRWDAAKFFRVAHGTLNWKEPTILVDPTMSELDWALEQLARATGPVATDTETAHRDPAVANKKQPPDPETCILRCVGVGNRDLGVCLNLVSVVGRPGWFKYRDGRFGPSRIDNVDLPRARERVRNFYAACGRLTLHNEIYDRPILARHGMPLPSWGETFDCYLDKETEFLTDSGWKRYAEVTSADRLGTIDANGQMQWQHYSRRVSKPYAGDLLTFETLRSRVVVTPNHRMWTRPLRRTASVWRGRPMAPWGFKPAQRMVDGSAGTDTFEIRQSASGLRAVKRPPREFIELLALFITDGTVLRRKDHDAGGISISQERNGKASPTLKRLDATYNFSYYEYLHSESWRARPVLEELWQIRDAKLGRQFESWCGRYSRNRRLPAFVWSWCDSSRRLLLNTLFIGDGGIVGDTWTYRTASKRLADDVHALALSLGYAAIASTSGGKSSTWYVWIRLDQPQTTPMRVTNAVRVAPAPADAVIVCFSVPNETLVTRSLGKPAFHGNTLTGHHVTDSELPHKLDFLSSRLTDAPKHKPGKFEWEDDEQHARYCVLDCVTSALIAVPIRDEVIASGQAQVYLADTKDRELCVGMHRAGMYVDQAEVSRHEQRLNALVADADNRAHAICGRSMNLGSHDQIRDYLFGECGLRWPSLETDAGLPSTGRDAVHELLSRALPPNVEAFLGALLDRRRAAKALDYVNAARRAGPDGRMHPSWSPNQQVVGRKSASNPAVQQWPGVKQDLDSLRSMIVAAPGNVLVYADMEQFHLRLIAEVAGDEPWKRLFSEPNCDMHTTNARDFFAIAPAEKVPKHLRDFSKALIFLYVYAGGAETAMRNVWKARDPATGIRKYARFTLAESQLLRKRILRAHPALHAWWEKAIETWRAQRFLADAYLGRKKYFKDYVNYTADDEIGRNEIINYGILALEGSLMGGAGAAGRLMDAVPFGLYGPGINFHGHDSMMLEVEARHEALARQLIVEAMSTRFGETALPAAVKVGRRFSELG